MTRLQHLIPCTCMMAFGPFAAAAADSRHDWGGTPSWIEIRPPDHEHRAARAEVAFHNETVHGPADNKCFPLRLDDFEVTVCFEWNVDGQAERATVIPPDGYIAQPPELVVDEGETDTLWIFGSTS